MSERRPDDQLHGSAGTSIASSPLLIAAIGFVLMLATIGWWSSGRFTAHGASGFVGVVSVLILDGSWALLWIASAIGYGSLVHAYLRRESTRLDSLSLAAGVAALLWLDHLLGWIGLLQVAAGIAAWLLIVIGLTGLPRLLVGSRRTNAETRSSHVFWLLALAILGFFATAATSAPGWLWDSEAGGFDALSYHLQLPHEWLTVERIVPLEHNVYSFLPSYVEAAYYHVAVLRDPFAPGRLDGAQAAALSCQLLHACISILAFVVVANMLRTWTGMASDHADPAVEEEATRRFTPALLAAAGLALPWSIVVGSLAYNEMPTILFAAASIEFIARRSRSTKPDGMTSVIDLVIVGFILGCACGSKLTAFGFVVIPAMLVFTITSVGQSRMLLCHVAVAIGGLTALLPYAIRNLIATNFTNPVFPFGTSVFGRAHWTEEQVARWTTAHLPDAGGVLDRLVSLWEMAFVYSHWAGWWFALVLAFPVALIIRSTRRPALLATMMLLFQLLFWLVFTHLQSRFLLPCVVTILILLALPIGWLEVQPGRAARTVARVLAGLVLLETVLLSSVVWSLQRGGIPAQLIDGLPFMHGLTLNDVEQQIVTQQNPSAWINVNLQRLDGRIYMLGDSTPFYLTEPVVYHTTWDASPLGEAVRETGGEKPNEWATYLKETCDVRFVLINRSELTRLIGRDNWYDPDVTLERIEALAESSALRSVMRWVNDPRGKATIELFEIR